MNTVTGIATFKISTITSVFTRAEFTFIADVGHAGASIETRSTGAEEVFNRVSTAPSILARVGIAHIADGAVCAILTGKAISTVTEVVV